MTRALYAYRGVRLDLFRAHFFCNKRVVVCD